MPDPKDMALPDLLAAILPNLDADTTRPLIAACQKLLTPDKFSDYPTVQTATDYHTQGMAEMKKLVEGLRLQLPLDEHVAELAKRYL